MIDDLDGCFIGAIIGRHVQLKGYLEYNKNKFKFFNSEWCCGGVKWITIIAKSGREWAWEPLNPLVHVKSCAKNISCGQLLL